jgi:lipoprotein-anchoring transpeptidase ErfK/SrfK
MSLEVFAHRFGRWACLGTVTGLALIWSTETPAQYYSSPPFGYYQGIEQAPLPPPTSRSAPGAYLQAPSYEDSDYGADRRHEAPRQLQVYGRPPPSPPSTRQADWGYIVPIPNKPVSADAASLSAEQQVEDGQPKELPPHLRRQIVFYPTTEPAGTIVIDTPNTYLYLVRGNNEAIRYGIGVGREGFTWSGNERITRKAEWPDWTPPKEMIERQPYLPRFMAGGPSNPLGARAMYLGGTVYRIHGTNQPSTIGTFVSSGCIRLINADIEDLYTRVQVGTRVVVLPGGPTPSISHQSVAAR